MDKRIPQHVFVISDATGRTAHSVIMAVLLQFPSIQSRVKKFPNVRTQEEVAKILSQATEVSGIVICSLVSKELRTTIQREGRRLGLIVFDLLGPMIEKVRKLFKLIPTSTPGLLEHVHEESIKVAEAIEFTMKHDDGLGMETIDKADLVILGVSRTSKTPTSIYLACNDLLKVANFPIIMDREIPQELYRLEIPKVGFTISPERLVSIRLARIKEIPDYTDLLQIHREVLFAEELFRKMRRIRLIDVTHMSIEESAARIMEAFAYI